MNNQTDADIISLADKIKASPYRQIIHFMLESHLPLKNILLLGLDFTAPLFSLFKPEETAKLRELLSEPQGLQTLISLIEE